MDALLDSLKPLADRVGRLAHPAGSLAEATAACSRRDAAALLTAVGGDHLARLALERAGALEGDDRVSPDAERVLAQVSVLVAMKDLPTDSWKPVMTVPDYLRGRIGPGAVTETFPSWYSALEGARARAVLAVPYLDDGFGILVPALGRLVHRGGTVLLLTQGLHDDRLGRNPAVVAALRSATAGGSLEVLSWEDGGLGLHAKVLVVDSELGYVGSANFTWAGMTAQAELGVEVRGPSVALLEGLLDQLAAELRARRGPHAG